MNLQTAHIPSPLRVLVINPLLPAAKMFIVKMMSGTVFGKDQLVDLTLLVYSNERQAAEEFKMELCHCAFQSTNFYMVSSDLPSISDADVFCFITNFQNPNKIDIGDMNRGQFNILYSITKIANSLLKALPKVNEPDEKAVKKNANDENLRKPIIMADGLITMYALSYVLKDLPSDIFFCPTSIPGLAKTVLGDQLKMQCNVINDILVWGACDEVFHIEVEKPLIIHDAVENDTKCDWDMIGKDLLKSVDLDHTQFNESWLKKELKDKVAMCASKNPYGNIYRAAEFARALQTVWKARSASNREKVYSSLGVISNGSLNTIKGCPYILPVVFTRENWTVNKRFEESSHLQQEICRINKYVKNVYQKLKLILKNFIEVNITNQAFARRGDGDSDSPYSFADGSVCSSRESFSY